MTECLKLDDLVVRVHPAAQLFPLMSDEELDELAADIAKNGLQQPIVCLGEELLDGRNRAAAIGRIPDTTRRHEITEELREGKKCLIYPFHHDPYGYVVSANLHRRHLTPVQKRDIITALLRDKPERSDRATAQIAHVSDKTVTSIRKELEGRSEIPSITIRRDAKGRHQPAKHRSRNRRSEIPNAEPAPAISPTPPTAVPPATPEPEELRSLLQLHPKSDDALIRMVWTNAVHHTRCASPPAIAPEPDPALLVPPSPPSLAQCTRNAFARIHELTVRIETAEPDELDLDGIGELITQARSKTDAFILALERHVPPGSLIVDSVLAALRRAGAKGLTPSELEKLSCCRKSPAELVPALNQLQAKRRASLAPAPQGPRGRGRPAKRWIAVP